MWYIENKYLIKLETIGNIYNMSSKLQAYTYLTMDAVTAYENN